MKNCFGITKLYSHAMPLSLSWVKISLRSTADIYKINNHYNKVDMFLDINNIGNRIL